MTVHKTASFLAVLAFLLVTAASLPAQAGARDSATTEAARATLRRDLRNFVTAQEAYFADHVTYAR